MLNGMLNETLYPHKATNTSQYVHEYFVRQQNTEYDLKQMCMLLALFIATLPHTDSVWGHGLSDV